MNDDPEHNSKLSLGFGTGFTSQPQELLSSSTCLFRFAMSDIATRSAIRAAIPGADEMDVRTSRLAKTVVPLLSASIKSPHFPFRSSHFQRAGSAVCGRLDELD